LDYRRNAEQKIKLAQVNNLIMGDETYQQYLHAIDNWKRLPRKKVCVRCGARGKTVLHHLNPAIRPKKIFPDSGINYIRKGDMLKTCEELKAEFFSDLNNLYQSTSYFATSYDDVIELCAKCHSLEHKKLKEK